MADVQDGTSQQEGDPENEEAATPTQMSDQIESDDGSPQTAPRRKAAARSRSRRTTGASPDPVQDETSDVGTPKRRRGGFRGTRGRGGRPRKGPAGPSTTTRAPVDKEGNTLDVVDDEVVLPEDAEGETKINKDGELHGGREYRVRTFTIQGRGKRLYMLSTEPARCTGFRDSYLFFAKHQYLYKIIINDDEKKDWIERGILPNSYKGRPIGVLTARSVFREFGAKIVVKGRKITDDYHVQEARDRGDVEGDLADGHDIVPTDGQTYNRNRYVAWHGASNVYHTDLPGMAPVGSKSVLGKRKAAITSANWMFEHARAASQFNAELAAIRRQNANGLYDPHTNAICYPQTMQPTHARWEQVDDSIDEPTPKRQRVDMVNGHNEPLARSGHGLGDTSSLEKPSSFVARNFLVVDTHYVTSPDAALPAPGPTLADDEGTIGTGSERRGLPDLSASELEGLPQEACAAYEYAKGTEQGWRSLWQGERQDGARAPLRISIAGM